MIITKKKPKQKYKNTPRFKLKRSQPWRAFKLKKSQP